LNSEHKLCMNNQVSNTASDETLVFFLNLDLIEYKLYE
jgi:hypothetical protein